MFTLAAHRRAQRIVACAWDQGTATWGRCGGTDDTHHRGRASVFLHRTCGCHVEGRLLCRGAQAVGVPKLYSGLSAESTVRSRARVPAKTCQHVAFGWKLPVPQLPHCQQVIGTLSTPGSFGGWSYSDSRCWKDPGSQRILSRCSCPTPRPPTTPNRVLTLSLSSALLPAGPRQTPPRPGSLCCPPCTPAPAWSLAGRPKPGQPVGCGRPGLGLRPLQEPRICPSPRAAADT